MTPIQKKRFFLFIGIALFVLGLSFIFLSNFSNTITFFVKPSDIIEKSEHQNTFVRLGAVVKEKSLKPDIKNGGLYFDLEDGKAIITVYYKGILPSLFREGQTIIAEGLYNSDKRIFIAEKILAKHDENYRPPTLEGKS